MRNRVDRLGVSEPDIRLQGTNQIVDRARRRPRSGEGGRAHRRRPRSSSCTTCSPPSYSPSRDAAGDATPFTQPLQPAHARPVDGDPEGRADRPITSSRTKKHEDDDRHGQEEEDDDDDHVPPGRRAGADAAPRQADRRGGSARRVRRQGAEGRQGAAGARRRRSSSAARRRRRPSAPATRTACPPPARPTTTSSSTARIRTTSTAPYPNMTGKRSEPLRHAGRTSTRPPASRSCSLLFNKRGQQDLPRT